MYLGARTHGAATEHGVVNDLAALGSTVLMVFGILTIAYKFWPISREHYFVSHPQQAWDDLATIENQTLGVSLIRSEQIDCVFFSQVCSLVKFLPSTCPADRISAIILPWARQFATSLSISSMACSRKKSAQSPIHMFVLNVLDRFDNNFLIVIQT